MQPKAGEGGGRRYARGSRTRKPDAEQQGAHSTRFPAWVYPLAILIGAEIGAFTPPAPQAGKVEGAVPRGAGSRTHPVQSSRGALSTRFPVWVYPTAPLIGMLIPPPPPPPCCWRLNEPSHLDLCCLTHSLSSLHINVFPNDSLLKEKKQTTKCRLKFGA